MCYDATILNKIDRVTINDITIITQLLSVAPVTLSIQYGGHTLTYDVTAESVAIWDELDPRKGVKKGNLLYLENYIVFYRRFFKFMFFTTLLN